MPHKKIRRKLNKTNKFCLCMLLKFVSIWHMAKSLPYVRMRNMSECILSNFASLGNFLSSLQNNSQRNNQEWQIKYAKKKFVYNFWWALRPEDLVLWNWRLWIFLHNQAPFFCTCIWVTVFQEVSKLKARH